MSQHVKSGADMRGFRWRVEPLLRKLQLQRDVARQVLVSAQREARVRHQCAQQVELEHRTTLAWAAAAPMGAPDPAAMSRALAHVLRAAARVHQARAHAEAGDDVARRARDACFAVESRLCCVEKMRDAAADLFRADQLRLAAKEADQLWLAARGRCK